MDKKMDCALCGEEDIQHPHRHNPLPLVVDHQLGEDEFPRVCSDCNNTVIEFRLSCMFNHGESDEDFIKRRNDFLYQRGFHEAAGKMWSDRETHLLKMKEWDQVMAMGALPMDPFLRQREVRKRLEKLKKAA